MKRYTNIIFDLDGTLSNSKEGITKCIQHALRAFGIVEDNPDTLEHFIGPPLRDELMKTYHFTKEKAEQATVLYRQRYEPVGIYEAEMYPGVESMLKELKSMGKTIALATSKPQEMAEEVLRYFGIIKYFDYIMGAERIGPRQSKTDVLQALFETMGIYEEQKADSVLIGDTCFDVEGAKNMGIDCIGVRYGFGREAELIAAGAVAVAGDTEEVMKIMKEV